MQEVTLPAQLGRPTGSRASRRLRAEGKIPAVLYGHGRDPLPLVVDRRALHSALSTHAGLNAFITLELDGERPTAMARELQRHPTRGEITHLDFVAVSAHEVVTAEVPIHLVGEADAVRHADGVVEHVLHSLTVRAAASAIPSHIDLDISGMTIGHTIRVSDLPLPAGVESEIDADEPVATATTAAPAPEDEAAAAEAAEEAAAEGGEAPAAEAAAREAADASTDAPPEG